MDGWLILLIILIILAIIGLIAVITFIVLPATVVGSLPNAPTNLTINNSLVTWTTVTNATSYNWNVTQGSATITSGNVVTPSVNLTLSPGTYIFNVSAVNNVGSSATSSITFTITSSASAPTISTSTTSGTTTATITTMDPVSNLQVTMTNSQGTQALTAHGSGHTWNVSYPANSSKYTLQVKPHNYSQTFPPVIPPVSSIVYGYNRMVGQMSIQFNEPVSKVDVVLNRQDSSVYLDPDETGPVSDTEWLVTFNSLPPGPYNIRIETRPHFAYNTTHTFD